MSSEFKTLFIILPTKSMFGDEISIAGQPHVGIAYLAAMVRGNNIGYKIVDMCLGYTYAEVLEVIRQYKPNLICITCFSCGYDRAYALIETIKSNFDQPIVIGGPHASAIRDRVLKETKADFAVIGEGEHTLVELINVITVLFDFLWEIGLELEVLKM